MAIFLNALKHMQCNRSRIRIVQDFHYWVYWLWFCWVVVQIQCLGHSHELLRIVLDPLWGECTDVSPTVSSGKAQKCSQSLLLRSDRDPLLNQSPGGKILSVYHRPLFPLDMVLSFEGCQEVEPCGGSQGPHCGGILNGKAIQGFCWGGYWKSGCWDVCSFIRCDKWGADIGTSKTSSSNDLRDWAAYLDGEGVFEHDDSSKLSLVGDTQCWRDWSKNHWHQASTPRWIISLMLMRWITSTSRWQWSLTLGQKYLQHELEETIGKAHRMCHAIYILMFIHPATASEHFLLKLSK